MTNKRHDHQNFLNTCNKDFKEQTTLATTILNTIKDLDTEIECKDANINGLSDYFEEYKK
jgi:hypothetical protein